MLRQIETGLKSITCVSKGAGNSCQVGRIGIFMTGKGGLELEFLWAGLS